MSLKVNNINFYNNNRVTNFKGRHDSTECKFEEDLERKYILDGFLTGHNEIEGKINNKPVYLKEEEKIDGKSYKGTMGGDYTEVEIKDKNISGKIGNKKVILSFDKNDYGEYFLRGVIGEKPVCITNNSDIEEANGEEDIITVVMSLLGHKITVKNGKFSTIGFSKQAKKDKTSQALSDWQIQQQNQMMAQSMIITKQIMENSDIFKEDSEDCAQEEAHQDKDLETEDLFDLIHTM